MWIKQHLTSQRSGFNCVCAAGQIPEQDETYGEDSFVVDGSEDESGGDDEERVEVVHEDSYVDGRKQYATRRRVQIRQIRAENGTSKRSRIVRLQDSSEEEEETESVFKEPPRLQSGSSVTERDDRKRQRPDELHFLPEKPVRVTWSHSSSVCFN